MGESLVDAANNGDKQMKEMAPSNPVLEVSVSFGRFENDSLSWERWSSFSPNKYLEEVEKCATPGSVAQKKAYFEEHYKKIAARKAELIGQGRPMESKQLKSEEQNGVDLTGNTTGPDSGFGIYNGQYTNEVSQETDLVSGLDETHVDEPNEEAATVEEDQSSLVEGVKEEIENGLESHHQMSKPEEIFPEQAVMEKKEEAISEGAHGIKESPMDSDRESKKNMQQMKVKKVMPDRVAKSSKIAPVAKESNASAVRKKPVSLATKLPQFSAPRASKPTPTSSTMSASRASTKIGSNSSVAKVKNLSTVGSRKMAPKSLHMPPCLASPAPKSLSLSLASPGPDSAPIWKSFIMEKMGDKEIVKRAFKTFQNNYGLQKSSGDDRPAAPKQVPSKGTGTRVSSLVTPRKENAGSLRVGGGEKKNAKAAPSSLGLKSDEREEKRKEFSKKLEEQAYHKETERTHILTKSEEEREVEIRKLRQSLNLKATPMPGFYRGQGVPKNSVDKRRTELTSHQ